MNRERKIHLLTAIGVMGTIGFLYAVVLAIIGLLRGNLGILIITAPLAILSHVIFGGVWNAPGEIKVLGKKLTWNELLRFGTLTCAGVIQILWG